MACAHARLGGPCRRIPAHNRASQLRLGSGGGRLGSRSVVSELEQAMGRRPAGSRPSDASAGAPGPWRSRCHRFRLPLTVGSESICVFGPHTHTHTARAVTVRCTHGAQSACPAPPRGRAQSESQRAVSTPAPARGPFAGCRVAVEAAPLPPAVPRPGPGVTLSRERSRGSSAASAGLRSVPTPWAGGGHGEPMDASRARLPDDSPAGSYGGALPGQSVIGIEVGPAGGSWGMRLALPASRRVLEKCRPVK